MGKYNQFSLFEVVIFYRVTANTELMHTESLPQGKDRVRFLRTSGDISIDQATHDVILCVFLFKDT